MFWYLVKAEAGLLGPLNFRHFLATGNGDSIMEWLLVGFLLFLTGSAGLLATKGPWWLLEEIYDALEIAAKKEATEGAGSTGIEMV